ncbi:hypothetical protein SAMN04488589_1039 [Methanolobus vulcani]|uniref:Uncharacterized protein n=1 Tax=Methanolobus vulcani TaxID=38026 RepID=A0A7Z7AYP4_9EURY|nr:hypothetical protein [Methanolobus vulcani]SDF65921.1 hypothetical protein SAMN04488589_1039 [Methanolobus vulcani]
MSLTTEIIGFTFGFLGVALALYSIIKQKNLEKRLKEKEKLKLLSTKINDGLLKDIHRFYKITVPKDDEDTIYQLDSLGRDIISTSYEHKEDTVIVETSTDITLENNKEISIENKGLILVSFREGKCSYVSLYCSPIGSSNMNYDIDSMSMLYLLGILENLNELENEFGSIIQEFKPELFSNLRVCITDIFEEIIDSACANEKIVVNIRDFDKAEDIGLWIHNIYLGLDRLLPLIAELKELENDLDEFREKLILTSYT